MLRDRDSVMFLKSRKNFYYFPWKVEQRIEPLFYSKGGDKSPKTTENNSLHTTIEQFFFKKTFPAVDGYLICTLKRMVIVLHGETES